MRDVTMWVLLMVVVLGMAMAEAGRHLHVHQLFETSSREDLVDLAGYGEQKLSVVLITGSVFFPNHVASATPQPISGVKVRVTCISLSGSTRQSSVEETITDEFGDFTLDLPSHVHGTRNLDKACKVKVIHKSVEHNKVILSLASARNGIRTYTTGKINLKRLEPITRSSTASAIIQFAKLQIDKWRG